MIDNIEILFGRMKGDNMGIFAVAGLILLYWIISKIQEHKGEKDCQKYNEDLKKRGLK